MEIKKYSIIGNYLNYVNGQNYASKGMVATECINYIVERVKNLMEKGFVSEQILEQITYQLPPQGVCSMNITAIQNSIASATVTNEMTGRTR